MNINKYLGKSTLKTFSILCVCVSLAACGGSGSNNKAKAPVPVVNDLDNDGIYDDVDNDIDGDGVENANDAFIRDSSEWDDTDADGIGDNTDNDIDGDGYANNKDAFERDITEWVDSDEDGIGNNSDTDDNGDGITDVMFTLDGNAKDGVIEAAQDFVISPNGQFMYVGSNNGLVIIRLDEQGKPIDDTRMISSLELNSTEAIWSYHLEFSSSGKLYWAITGNFNDVGISGILVFEVNESTGEVALEQTLSFKDGLGLNVGSPEIFKISIDGKFLYTTTHYSDVANELLIYSIAEDGHLSFVENFDLDVFGAEYPDWEHNLDISFDGKYLYYGFTENQMDVLKPGIGIITLDTNSGKVLSSKKQIFDMESKGLSLITSKLSNQLFISAGGKLMKFEYGVENGELTQLSEILYDISNPMSVALVVNEAEDGVGVYSDYLKLHRLDYFTIDQNSVFTHEFSKENLDDFAISIIFSGNDQRLNWLDHNSDILYSVDVENSEVIESEEFDSIGINYLKGFFLEQPVGLAINYSGTPIQIKDLGNSKGLEFKKFKQPMASSEIETAIAIDNKTVLLTKSNYEMPSVRTVYQVSKISDDSDSDVNTVTRFLGDTNHHLIVYRMAKIPGSKRVLTFEYSANTDHKWGLSLYKIADDGALSHLSSIVEDRWEPAYMWNNLLIDNGYFYIANKAYSYADDTLTFVTEMEGSQMLFSDDSKYAYSADNNMLSSYSYDANDGFSLNSTLDNYGTWKIAKISANRILLTSNNVDNIVQMQLYQINTDGSLSLITKRNLATTSPSWFIARSYLSEDGSDTFLVSVRGGYHDLIKVSLQADSDTDGDGVFDSKE